MDMRTYLRMKCEEDKREAEHRQNIIFGIASVFSVIGIGVLWCLAIILA